MTTDIQSHIDALADCLRLNGVKLDTVKAKLMEHAYIVGLVTAFGGVHKIPPAIALCAMSGRSITTLNQKPQV